MQGFKKNKLKVTVFYVGKYPDGFSPMSYRLHNYFKALNLNAVQVEIIMPTNEPKKNGVFEGIPYSYILTKNRNAFNGYLIAKEYAKICGSISKKCDVLFTTVKNNLSLKFIIAAVHKNNGKIALEINENPYSFKARRLDIKPLRRFKRYYFLKYILPKTDGVIVISKKLEDLVKKYINQNTPLIKIPILSSAKEIKRNNSNTGMPYILHAGALSESKDGIKAMLEAFALANKKLNYKLKFVFTSKKALPNLNKWINRFVKQNNLKDFIEFKGIVPKQELDKLYDGTSLVIVNKPSNFQNDFNFPTKLTEILPREIPLIVSATGELKNYFKDCKNAFVVAPNNINQISKKGKLLAIDKFYFSNYSVQLYNFFKKVQ